MVSRFSKRETELMPQICSNTQIPGNKVPEGGLINHIRKKNIQKVTIESILKMEAKEPSNALKPPPRKYLLSNPV